MSVARYSWLSEVLSARGPRTAKCRLVACGLFIHMDRFGIPATFVSLRTLEVVTGLSATEVRRQLQQLDADGWVIRKEKGRGQYGSTLYAYEAMIPPDSMRQPPAQQSEPPMRQPPAQQSEPPMRQPPAANAPNPLKPLRQPLALIRSDPDQSKNPDMCPSGTDQGVEKDRWQLGASK